jgi:hypothetical protein
MMMETQGNFAIRKHLTFGLDVSVDKQLTRWFDFGYTVTRPGLDVVTRENGWQVIRPEGPPTA